MAGYRDDTETLRARVRELESKAEGLRRRVTENEAPLPKKKELVWESEFRGVLDEDAYDDIVSLLRSKLDPLGVVQRVGSTLTWSVIPNQQSPASRNIAITVESRRGKTRIRIVEKLNMLWTQNMVGIMVGLGWLGAFAGGAVAGALSPLAIPVGIIGPLAGLYAWARGRYQKKAKERRLELGEVHESLTAIARAQARVAQVRVETEAELEEIAEPVAPKRETDA